ncbi:hypothetical protein JCM13304A_02930 [Desulfothermus okinawensis JCM 13304]
MKKVLVMLAALLMVAGSAMAMKAISNDQMDSITGQAGVSIAVDDVKLYQHIQGLWYTDTDGLDVTAPSNSTDPGANYLHTQYSGNGASVGIKDLEVMVNVNAITSADVNSTTGEITAIHSIGRELQGTYGAKVDYTNNADNTAFLAKPITIDVTDRLPVLSAGAAWDAGVLAAQDIHIPDTNFAGVMIGLGTLEIVQSDMTIEIALSGLNPLDDDNLDSINGHDFGTFYIGKTTLAILDGVIEIAPH